METTRIDVTKILCLLLFFCGCADLDSAPPAQPAAPPESYVQPALRNWNMPTVIEWNLQFTPGDPNAAGEYVRTGPTRLLTALNSAGAADGNTFPQGTYPTNFAVRIVVSEFSDKNPTNERHSLKADVWALAHTGEAFYVSTESYSDTDEMIDDLANKIYNYFHLGWHTPDRN